MFGKRAASESSSPKDKGDKITSSSTNEPVDTSSSAPTTSVPTKDKETTESVADKYKKFENEGVLFKAKLIGSELVMEPRGDKMCQNSIQRLKAIIKGTNSHKKRISLKISYDGVKVYDEKSNELLHHHEVSQISYIAGDDTDNRTFGYVSDVPNKAHQFICFKTSGPAINVMSTISSLFEAVLERKNQLAGKDKQEQQVTSSSSVDEGATKVGRQDSIDLIGDSGIMDGDLSNSLIGTSGIGPGSSSLGNKPITRSDTLDKNSSSMLDSLVMASSPAESFSATSAGKSKQQSTMDLIFDDLFGGLTDPIIVDKNDSLISYKGNFSKNNSAMQPPASLPKQAPMFHSSMNSSNQGHNRSLVYNHSSVSLSDAALTRQSSFNAPTPALSAHQNSQQQQQFHQQQQYHHHHNQQQQQQQQPRFAQIPSRSLSVSSDPNADRYAVFNDIDNLPSIFESTSLSSVNTMSNQMINNIGASSSDMTASGNINHHSTNPSNANSNAAMINNFASSSAFNHFAGMSSSMGNSNNFNNSMNFGGVASFSNNSNSQLFNNNINNKNPNQLHNFNNLNQSNVVNQRSSSSNNISSSVFRQTNPFDDDFFA